METWWPREEGKFREMEMVGFFGSNLPCSRETIDRYGMIW